MSIEFCVYCDRRRRVTTCSGCGLEICYHCGTHLGRISGGC